MAEQLVMTATGQIIDGRRSLEPRGPRWQWQEMDADHWVGYPDKKVKVVDMSDDWLANVLAYLAKWTEQRVAELWHVWWVNSVYTGDGPNGDAASMAFDSECDRLTCSTTHRTYLEEFIVPCLKVLEAEARRRGIGVPAIPSYKCPVTRSREKQQAEDDARKAKRAAEVAKAREKVETRRVRAEGRAKEKARVARETKKHGRAKRRCSLCRSPTHTAPHCPKNPRNKP